jgi:hypothetical protein
MVETEKRRIPGLLGDCQWDREGEQNSRDRGVDSREQNRIPEANPNE